MDFYAATIAIMGGLLLGIGHSARRVRFDPFAAGTRVAAACCPSGTHPRNQQLLGSRPSSGERAAGQRDCLPTEASLLYVNAGSVLETIMASVLGDRSKIRAVVCDLSASPYVDLAGARMLRALHDDLAAQGIALHIVGARGRVPDLLRADGLAEKVGGLERAASLDDAISAACKRAAET
jgi:MFS superfamily sulfate permease-like transporter